MTARTENPARVFDGFLISLTLMGGLIALIGLVAAFRAPAATTVVSGPTIIEVGLSEFAITGGLSAPAGEVQLRVTNNGGQVHNLAIEGGPVSPDLAPGESTVLNLGELEAGTYRLICEVPGHLEAGMEATLAVGGGTEGGDGGHGEMTPAEMDQVMIESILAYPAETEGKGNQLLEPTILPDGTKQFDLVAAVTPWEVEPEKFVDAWTYNGMVPGPMIRVEVGDQVRVRLTNQLEVATDIHFHGLLVPNSMDGVSPLTQEPIRSGDTFDYDFEILEPAVAMYHAHLHSQEAVPNGMFATIFAGETPIPRGETVSGREIPADLEVAMEIPMVLNDAGVIGLSLNGKSFPATEPYVLETGDWLVAHYFNEGLQIHPMHQHQFPQLVFSKDGIPLDHPYWVDTLNVAPGERYSVLMHADSPGVWVWHCHILTHAERATGMFGMVTALIVNDA
ncbi:MAG TPA: multicopper oxidase domain-containing protein [Acidimicrobiia bacterium]|nr:multicopper oxidase domain-containing protein [Acidimicrobiia bacterium]